jgi:hypothetical protein
LQLLSVSKLRNRADRLSCLGGTFFYTGCHVFATVEIHSTCHLKTCYPEFLQGSTCSAQKPSPEISYQWFILYESDIFKFFLESFRSESFSQHTCMFLSKKNLHLRTNWWTLYNNFQESNKKLNSIHKKSSVIFFPKKYRDLKFRNRWSIINNLMAKQGITDLLKSNKN